MNISKSLVIPPPKRRQPEYLIARSLPAVQIGTSMTRQHTQMSWPATWRNHRNRGVQHLAGQGHSYCLSLDTEHAAQLLPVASTGKGAVCYHFIIDFSLRAVVFSCLFPLRGYFTLVLSADAVLKTSNKISPLSLASLRIV